jgi:hypothetical protein
VHRAKYFWKFATSYTLVEDPEKEKTFSRIPLVDRFALAAESIEKLGERMIDMQLTKRTPLKEDKKLTTFARFVSALRSLRSNES